MENLYIKNQIPTYFFNLDMLSDIKSDLIVYLYNNLYIENYMILRWDLKIALTINANGEYI